MTDLSSLLIQAQNASNNLRASGTQASAARAAPAPVTPLSFGAPQIPVETLVGRALTGAPLIDANSLNLARRAEADDERFFALFRGLDTLRALATAAARDPARGERSEIPTTQRARANRLFQEGVNQVKALADSLDFRDVTAVSGSVEARVSGDRLFQRSDFDYIGRVISSPGSTQGFEQEPAAFQGDVRFTVTGTTQGGAVSVDLDFSQISGPRNFTNVVSYINDQLSNAGFLSRFSAVAVGPENAQRVVTSNRFALKLEGVASERISFTPASDLPTAPTAFLVGARGTGATSQIAITRVQDPSSPAAASDELAVLSAQGGGLVPKQSARAPDGSLYVLSETQGSVGGEAIKGTRDVVLQKLDNTGKIIFSRSLGLGTQGSAFALAVNQDGSVAVAGSLRGRVDAQNTPTSRSGEDAFVARFDAQGREIFVRQQPAFGDNVYRAVAFTPDGGLVLGGRTQSSLVDGQVAQGSEAFIEALDSTGQRQYLRQFSNPGEDDVDALAVDNTGNIVVALNQGGASLIQEVRGAAPDPSERSFTLGALDGGRVADLAFINGDLLVAGSVGANGLAGTLTGSRGGSTDGFLARLDRSGANFAANYVQAVSPPAGGAESIDAIEVLNGEVYLAGTTDQAFAGANQAGARNAFLSRLAAQDGSILNTTQIAGNIGERSGGLIIDPAGSSVLTQLGLPTGQIGQPNAVRVIDRTSARPGDFLFVRVNDGPPRRVALRAEDSLSAITFRINQALGTSARAEIRSLRRSAAEAIAAGDVQADNISGGSLSGDRLVITPRVNQRIELVAGASGQDLLRGLGLSPGLSYAPPASTNNNGNPGLISNGSSDRQSPQPRFLELGLTETLSLDNRQEAQRALDNIRAAQSAIRNTYRELNAPPTPPVSNAANGPVPAFVQAQLANLRAGLARLQSGQQSIVA